VKPTDFIIELQLARAASTLPLAALVRGIDPAREELAVALEAGRAPCEVFEEHGLLFTGSSRDPGQPPPRFEAAIDQAASGADDGAYTLRVFAFPLGLLALALIMISVVLWFYLRVMRPLFRNVLGPDAAGFEGMWQVQFAFWLVLSFGVICLALGLVQLLTMATGRSSKSWALFRAVPSVAKLDRLDRPRTNTRMGKRERSRQLGYAADASEFEWASMFVLLVVWVAPVAIWAVLLPLIRLITGLQG